MILRLPRRLQASILAVVALLALFAFTTHRLSFNPTAQVIPVPDPIVTVTTDSGSIHRTWLVPIGGAPIPMDVSHGDGLSPDITASVGLIAVDQLPASRSFPPSPWPGCRPRSCCTSPTCP